MGTDLHRWVVLLVRRLPLIALFTVVGAAAGYGAVPPRGGYSSSAELLVGTPGAAPNVFYNSQTQQGQELLAVTFAAMIDTPAVAQAAVTTSGVPRDAGTALAETTATAMTGTSLINVTVTDRDPRVAQRLADAMATAAVARIGTLDPVKDEAGTAASPSAPLTVSQSAGLDLARPPRPVKRYVAGGAVFGLAVGLALVLIVDYVARRPREESPSPERLLASVPAAEGAEV